MWIKSVLRSDIRSLTASRAAGSRQHLRRCLAANATTDDAVGEQRRISSHPVVGNRVAHEHGARLRSASPASTVPWTFWNAAQKASGDAAGVMNRSSIGFSLASAAGSGGGQGELLPAAAD